MSLAHAAASIEAINRAKANIATFGHLAPEPDRTYTGTILFAHCPYGGALEPLAVDFTDLPDSPWFAEDMNKAIGGWLDDARRTGRGTDGELFLFTGTYRRAYPEPISDDLDDDAWEAARDEQERKAEAGDYDGKFSGTVARVDIGPGVLAAGVERARQIDAGHTVEADAAAWSGDLDGVLAKSAGAYALHSYGSIHAGDWWVLPPAMWRGVTAPGSHADLDLPGRLRSLELAAALLAAEHDRLLYLAEQATQPEQEQA